MIYIHVWLMSSFFWQPVQQTAPEAWCQQKQQAVEDLRASIINAAATKLRILTRGYMDTHWFDLAWQQKKEKENLASQCSWIARETGSNDGKPPLKTTEEDKEEANMSCK